MITKLLIANRGEIACRIMRTCQRLGIKTVAVYSDVDQLLPHVDMADEAYCLGPAPSRDSYLNIEKIIRVAKESGAEAVHPGYGFLSEKTEFAEAVIKAGLIFVGPAPTSIRAMGDKLEAKRIAERAGVNLVPGTPDPVSTVAEVEQLAQKIGYPLLIKAAAGGGGKGMRVVHSHKDLKDSLERAQSEAQTGFGDSRVFVEKYIENPRHIEIQVLGDKHGNVVHLGERDCSLQRRHQKVVEESPSPVIADAMRDKMAEQAVALAKATNYDSAGTVEFITSPKGDFYFLEMNTRLQVEHPVTEERYDLDLVEEMIRISCGEPLRYKQADLMPKGYALEVRLYAEDADQDFLPSAGKLVQYYAPTNLEFPGLRFDNGYTEGDQVSIYYDPMIAKIIAHAPTRLEALGTVKSFLSAMLIDGPVTNQNFLCRLLSHGDVVKGNYHTHFIQDHSDSLLIKDDLTRVSKDQQVIFNLAAALIDGIIHNLDLGDLCCVSGDQQTLVTIDEFEIALGGKSYSYDFHWIYQHQVFELTIEGHTYYGRTRPRQSGHDITLFGQTIFFSVIRPDVISKLKLLPKSKVKADVKTVKAPMPGTVISLPITVGQKIKKGQPLAIIEAMKMENVLKATTEGTVSEICVKNGDSLSRDQVIARFA